MRIDEISVFDLGSLEHYPLSMHKRAPEESSMYGFGGDPPTGIRPKYIDADTRYLLTAPIERGYAVSLFTGWTYEKGHPLDYCAAIGKIIDDASRYVQCVVHTPKKQHAAVVELRGSISPMSFEIGARTMEAGAEAVGQDVVCGPREKIGGWPYYEHSEDDVERSTCELLSCGYVHALQIGTGTPGQVSGGDWPFGELVFHMFAKRLGSGVYRFAYSWG